MVHKACPGVVETMKWSRPFFEYKGAIVGNMSAFNEHCSWGFWGEEISAVLRDMKVLKPGAMGSLGRLTSVDDLPPKKEMLGVLKQAVAFIDKGEYTSPIAARQKVVKAPGAAGEAAARVREGTEGQQEGRGGIRGVQSRVARRNTWSGLRTPSARRRATSGSRLRSSGSARASSATGSTRTARGHCTHTSDGDCQNRAEWLTT